ncbi:hypothetical protein MNBD_GAMMA08-1438 [hydrothermal vent metagenome]|uniref:Uncharacterized protein n=1 Tax=hydrothermal vent metagenome TaxID=652676 RepID=A0A3B0WZT9_9ZZZZ
MLETDISILSKKYEETVEALTLSLQSTNSPESQKILKMIGALRQNIQIMLRLTSDVENKKQLDISEDEITKIGDYALNLLDEISINFASRGMQNQMLELHRLSLPVAIWLNKNGGKIKKLDIVVNAIASYANTLQDNQQLEILCNVVSQVIEVTDAEIKQDLEATNPMRPWRILNLNWGIVATRTHNTEIMQRVFDQLIKNIPADTQQFFNEGMQQMDAVGYPEPVREVMEKYAGGFGVDGVLH